jgi:hexosaminidase
MMFWRDWVADSPARSAANGNPIIITDWSRFYLSSPGTDENLQNLYSYNPVDLYPAPVISKVRGMQGCVWTEEIPSEAVFEKQVFPRMQALAEVCWSPGRTYLSFQQRMKAHFNYMNAQNIHYRRPTWAN